jgi:hypothetical protein
MARTVRETFRQYLPGAGRDVLGNPKQGKTRVVASINVTSYTRGGESLTAADLSLATIDHINMRVVDELRTNQADADHRIALYSDTTAQFYLVDVDGAGSKDEADAADTDVVTVIAEGDSAYDVELH